MTKQQLDEWCEARGIPPFSMHRGAHDLYATVVAIAMVMVEAHESRQPPSEDGEEWTRISGPAW